MNNPQQTNRNALCEGEQGFVYWPEQLPQAGAKTKSSGHHADSRDVVTGASR